MQLQSAQFQVQQLRDDLKNYENRIADVVRQAMSGKQDAKEQESFKAQTTILYSMWIATDVMLQKLMVSCTMRSIPMLAMR